MINLPKKNWNKEIRALGQRWSLNTRSLYQTNSFVLCSPTIIIVVVRGHVVANVVLLLYVSSNYYNVVTIIMLNVVVREMMAMTIDDDDCDSWRLWLMSRRTYAGIIVVLNTWRSRVARISDKPITYYLTWAVHAWFSLD